MGNMSYCRFENTLSDMHDCFDNLYDVDEMSQYEKELEKVSSIDLLEQGLRGVRGRLNDTEERISEVDGTLHELLAYKSRLERVVKMLQAIELEKKNET